MKSEVLTQFGLSFPGNWIEGDDRAWAAESLLTLRHIKGLFEEAVAAYSQFDPITIENHKEKCNESVYSRCLNNIYAKAFVFALDGINKLIQHLQPKEQIEALKAEYESRFGHLKHIRDSAIHLEDRGRGKDRHQEKLNTSIIILGCFAERRFTFTGEDGRQYEIEISQSTLLLAKEILTKILDTYKWF